MDASQVLEIGQDLLFTTLLLILPTLAVSLAVGLLFGILQTITSIQEQTLTFIPRIIAVGLVIVLTMSWSMQLALHFTIRMLEYAAEVVH
jgi:flagellar biosynthesis protein FliQ